MRTHQEIDGRIEGQADSAASAWTAGGRKGRVEARVRWDPDRLTRLAFGAVATTVVILLAAGCGDSKSTGGEGTQSGVRPDGAARPTFTPTTPVSTESASPERFAMVEFAEMVVSPVTYEEAEAVFRTGDYRVATVLFERYSERVPTNPWGPYMMGISAWRDLDHEKAESALRRTIEIDPDHTKGLLNLARVLLERGKASDALAFAAKVTEMEPDSGEGWRVLGNIHAEIGVPDAAAEAYRHAIAIDPTDAWTMNNLGLLRIEEGRYGDAIPPLARATELRPDVARFQNNLGVALERTGRMAQAVNAYAAALVTDESYDKAKVSFERTTALVSLSTMPPIDLAQLASSFTDEVERWRGAVVMRPEAVDAPH